MSNQIQNYVDQQYSQEPFVYNNNFPTIPIPSAMNAIEIAGATHQQPQTYSIPSVNSAFSSFKDANESRSKRKKENPTDQSSFSHSSSTPSSSSSQSSSSKPILKIAATTPAQPNLTLLGLPSDILDTIIPLAGTKLSSLLATNKNLNAQVTQVMDQFWIDNFESPALKQANPEIYFYIINLKDQLRIAKAKMTPEAQMKTPDWDDLTPAKKLRELYCNMTKIVQERFPNRLLEFPLYQQMIYDINLLTFRNVIAATLPDAAGLSPSAFRRFLNNPNNLAQIQSVNFLDLSKLNMTQLPREINHFSNLQNLVLSSNCICRLPNDLNLPKLEMLSLADNRNLTSFPNRARLPRLGLLVLTNTRITTIPSDLPNLHTLELSGSQITEIGDNRLPRLQSLCLNNTPFSQSSDQTVNNSWNNVTIVKLNNNTEPSIKVSQRFW